VFSFRGVVDMKSLALFILLNIAMVIAHPGIKKEVVQNLECTNDLDELMTCEFEAQNCTEYDLTLRSESRYEELQCNLQQCAKGRCCCSFQMILVLGETHNATVFKEGERMGSKVISISEGIKPRVPTNISVKESNGNFQVMWNTNMNSSISDELTANVTYRKKGHTEKVSKYVTPTKINGRSSYEILGRDLEPSTTYMVSVKSYTEWSHRFSDSSEEVEFTTRLKGEVDQNLECTNDLEKWMTCEFEAQNCTEYNLTLRSDSGYGELQCNLQQCAKGRCCCSFQMILVLGETHTATVFKEGERMGSKVISISEGIKPRVPTDVSVKESNGNFQVMWNTNMQDSIGDELTANVTYRKKGHTVKVSKHVTPTKINGRSSYEILGRDLEPSTTYMVSVKSYTEWSHRFSDSSEEVEFTTPASTDAPLLAVIISLSLVAIIVSGAIYGCYVMFKTKWWDTVAKCPNPKLLDMRPREQALLKPSPPTILPVCVEPLDPDDQTWLDGSLRDTGYGSPQQSSGISTGSSCLSYANAEPIDIIGGVQEALGKALANISPISPLTINPLSELNKDSGLFSAPNNLCGTRAEDVNSGSSGIDNQSYSLLIPNFPPQIVMDSSELQTQSKMLCDSAYHPSEGEIVLCPDQQVPACPLPNLPAVASSLMATDMSYQQCNADSGRFSYEEDSSLSSISSGTNTIASCDLVCRCESSDEVAGGAIKLSEITEEATICDDNPFYGCVPTRSFPQVDDDYQAFQNLVEQQDMLLLEKSHGAQDELLDRYPEDSFTKMPQSFPSPVVPDFIKERPFVCLIPADQSLPVITDSDYQSV
ncbi:hypothetical protein GBF38_007102, partial [Nibea albiflora]